MPAIPPATTTAPTVIDAVQAVLDTHPELLVGLVYGSAASGRIHAGSDVDVAVLAREALGVEQKLALINELGAATHREVDLLDLHDATGTILAEALCNGRRVLMRDVLAMAGLVRRMQNNQADEMPNYRMILDERRRRFTDEP